MHALLARRVRVALDSLETTQLALLTQLCALRRSNSGGGEGGALSPSTISFTLSRLLPHSARVGKAATSAGGGGGNHSEDGGYLKDTISKALQAALEGDDATLLAVNNTSERGEEAGAPCLLDQFSALLELAGGASLGESCRSLPIAAAAAAAAEGKTNPFPLLSTTDSAVSFALTQCGALLCGAPLEMARETSSTLQAALSLAIPLLLSS